MKRLLLFTLAVMVWMAGSAQNYFEGTLKARSYENHSNIVIKFSKGMLVNGARDAEMYIKGKKLAVVDKTTNVQTIYNLEERSLYFLFPYIKKAIQMPTSHFDKLTAGNVTPTPTDVYKTISGVKCRLYKSNKNDKVQGGSINIKNEIYLSEELLVDPALGPFITSTGIPRVGMKYIIDSNTKAGIMTMNSYTAYEVKEVIPGKVDGAIFEIPADYEIVDGSSNTKMLGVYSENNKVMKKMKKGKVETEKEITFDINEEWDF